MGSPRAQAEVECLGPEVSKEAGAAGRVGRGREKSAGSHRAQPECFEVRGVKQRRSQGLVGRVRLAFSHSLEVIGRFGIRE